MPPLSRFMIFCYLVHIGGFVFDTIFDSMDAIFIVIGYNPLSCFVGRMNPSVRCDMISEIGDLEDWRSERGSAVELLRLKVA